MANKSKNLKLSRFIESFLLYLGDKSKQTIKGYKTDLKQFLNFMGDREVNNISKSDVIEFKIYLQKKGLSSSSIARKMASLNSFFQYLIELEIIKSSPVTRSMRPKISQKIPSALTSEELKKVLNTADDNLIKTAISLMAFTGLRASELLGIKKDDIFIFRSEEKKTININTAIAEGLKPGDIAFIRVMGKGDKERIIPVPDQLLTILIEHLKTCKSNSVFPITYFTLWYQIKKVGQKASIDLHPHKLRHTSATMALSNGADIRTIQELLGHATPATTARYAKVTQESLIKAVQNSIINILR